MQKTRQRIKDIKEISIAIDSWDDVFSDFDPRPFQERTLSEDFITELKKRYRETRTGYFTIVIFAPYSLRDEETEKIVIQRLKRYFRHRHLQKKREIGRIRLRGLFFVITGVICLTLLTFITFYKIFGQLAIEILGIIMMPLGWFGIWEGFSKIVDVSSALTQEQTLYARLSSASYDIRYIYEYDENTDNLSYNL